jgi:hypothetical protein
LRICDSRYAVQPLRDTDVLAPGGVGFGTRADQPV